MLDMVAQAFLKKTKKNLPVSIERVCEVLLCILLYLSKAVEDFHKNF